jgi:TRAP-type mannitol/chloroaromatic compound transport system permease small subunit
MLRGSIRFPLLYFVVSIIWQLIVNREVKWVDNIGICFVMFLLIIFYNWSRVPYKWTEDNDK